MEGKAIGAPCCETDQEAADKKTDDVLNVVHGAFVGDCGALALGACHENY